METPEHVDTLFVFEKGSINTIIKDNHGTIYTGGKRDDENAADDVKTAQKPLTEEELKEKVDFVKPNITAKKQYFSVCRYMMWRKMVPERDFKGACAILERLYPGLGLDADDMDSYYVLSFRKPLDEWDVNDAPVHGKTFNKYYTIAELMDV